jgi:hypothetical protein
MVSDNRDYLWVVELAREILETEGQRFVPGKPVFTSEINVNTGIFFWFPQVVRRYLFTDKQSRCF